MYVIFICNIVETYIRGHIKSVLYRKHFASIVSYLKQIMVYY